MKISLDWLRDFVTWDLTPTELADGLTMLGLNVEGMQEYVLAFPGVVVGQVLESQRHANADRLSLCRVDVGDEQLQVVCGAANVRKGLHVLLARPGAVLPGGMRITQTKIRGCESHGMICSASELGLGGDAQGIMELAPDTVIGTAADELFGFRDVVLDIEVTPNRPDWLSHFGVAREVAALTAGKLSSPRLWSPGSGGWEKPAVSVEIEEFGDCPRYMAHVVKHVVIGDSPPFIQNRLRAVGMRPINNVVDITNYVMLELGQPLHAFDGAKLSGSRLFVRRASAGQQVVTLDGQQRTLTTDHLVIADGAGPVAVAGVMGLQRSEVDETTREIVLESAFFDPLVVRNGRRRLGLVTESSYRFEREADWQMVETAAQRALYLLQEHAEGRVLPDRADRQDPDRPAHANLLLRLAQVNRLLGTQIGATEAAGLLQRLGLKVTPLGKASERGNAAASLMVEVPSFRRDIAQEVDLIEEIARVHGYDKIPVRGNFRGGRGERRARRDRAIQKIRRHLADLGFFEMVSSSFICEQDLDRMELAEDDPRRRCLSIANPHHGGGTLLRPSLLPSLLEATRRNVNADNPLPIKLFQVNKVFWPHQQKRQPGRHPDEGLLPAEPMVLQIGLAGMRGRGLAGVPQGLLQIKGMLENLSQLLRRPLSLAPRDREPYFDRGLQWDVLDADRQRVGNAGAVAPRVLAAYEIEEPLAVAELELGRMELTPVGVKYTAFSRFPAVKRDLSLVVPGHVSYEQLIAVVRAGAGRLLESVHLFDIYRGAELPEKSAAFGIRLKFRSDQGNLKGKTVDAAIAALQKDLMDRLDVRLRG